MSGATSDDDVVIIKDIVKVSFAIITLFLGLPVYTFRPQSYRPVFLMDTFCHDQLCHHYTVFRSTCIYIQATQLQTCIIAGYILS